jgi:hypothetical protein
MRQLHGEAEPTGVTAGSGGLTSRRRVAWLMALWAAYCSRAREWPYWRIRVQRAFAKTLHRAKGDQTSSTWGRRPKGRVFLASRLTPIRRR